jgi:hypothetical protein
MASGGARSAVGLKTQAPSKRYDGAGTGNRTRVFSLEGGCIYCAVSRSSIRFLSNIVTTLRFSRQGDNLALRGFEGAGCTAVVRGSR